MKNCHKWMILCVVIASAVVFLLPQLGVTLVGASLVFPLLLILCCVLPMVMMFSNSKEEPGGCCGKKDKSKIATPEEKEKTSCH